MKVKTDKSGRVVSLDRFADPDITMLGGNSVCNICGKNMPNCWDTVCVVCWKTFCYKCSKVFNERWYCKEHVPNLGKTV